MNPICPYCGMESKKVFGSEIYCGFKQFEFKVFYECLPCDAHVGCHGYGIRPMGTLANYALRQARRVAHTAFDQVWNNPKITKMNRTLAYTWLARQTGIAYKECHIGMMDIAQCNLVTTIVNQYKETW